jgi:hypothetical protein
VLVLGMKKDGGNGGGGSWRAGKKGSDLIEWRLMRVWASLHAWD